MKKLFSLVCAALLVGSAVLPASAAGVEKWKGGNGFLISDKNSPVTVTEAKDGIKVSHGGYYVDGINWGGVAYTEKVTLDGFSAEIRIDKLPTVDASSDTWISLDFLANPQLFQVSANYTKNMGISNLIRYANAEPHIQSYGPDKWAAIANDKNAAYSVKAGDTLTVSVAKKDNKYVLTINGVALTSAYDLSTISPDGKAYFVISASMKDSKQDDFQYTITKINGKSTVTAAATNPTTTAPKTADMTLIIAAVCLVSLAGAAIVTKKLRRE